MFRWLITLLLFRGVLTLENVVNYHEPTLQNVTLYGTESFASGIPLFTLERDQPMYHAICITKSTVLQYVSLALATCRALGYDALQRIYSSDAHLLNNSYHNRGLLLDLKCNILEPELRHCKWHYARMIPCPLYLAVHCTECKHMMEITDGTEQEIVFPALTPCYQHARCAWNIRNNQSKKKTVLEFKIQNADSSLPVASVPRTADQMLEIQWFDSENSTWCKIRETFTRIANMGPIKIHSNSIMIHYFFEDCQFFDLTRFTQENIASLKYYNEEYVFYKEDTTSYFLPVASGTLLVTLIMTVSAGICCCIKKMKQKMYSKQAFTVTYTPGLDVTYEEDKTQPAGEYCSHTKYDTWPAIYHQLSLEDRPDCLPSFTSHDCNKSGTRENLRMDTKLHQAEPLRRAVTQLATLHRKASIDAQKYGPEEDVFSCSSHESLHSYYSVYPFACNSVSSSDSFVSINQELQNSSEIFIEN